MPIIYRLCAAFKKAAANLGAGNFADDDPERQVTRTEFARALISAAGYSKASQLSGIYVCEFEDASEIPENDIGVVAIAHALGIIAPDDNNMINSQEPLTRAQAAEIAYNFLSVKK